MNLFLKSLLFFYSPLLLVLSAPLSAQSPPSKNSPDIKVEFRQYGHHEVARILAPQLGVVEGTPLYSRLVNKLARNLSNPNPPRIPTDIKTERIVKHYRFDEGISLPKNFSYLSLLPQQSQQMNDYNPEDPKHEMATAARKRGTEALYTPPKLPACKDGHTITKQHPAKSVSKGKDEIVIFDMLILKDSAPRNLESASSDFSDTFGVATKVRHYSTQLGDIIALEASRHGVTCLPFRIRVTNKIKYHDTGVNALKNYDSNQSGTGTLHRIIKKKLNRFL